MIRIERGGIDELADDLEAAADSILDQVEKITGMACNKIKRDAQKIVRGHPHIKHISRSFNYDVTREGTTVIGEVGASHQRKQGVLDHLIEFGSPTSAPLPHWRPATDKEVPVWERYIEQAAVDAIEKRG